MKIWLCIFLCLPCYLFAASPLSVLFVNPSVKNDPFWHKVEHIMQVVAEQQNVSLKTIYGDGNRHIQLSELANFLKYNQTPDFVVLIN